MYFSSENFSYRKLVVYQHARAFNKTIYILLKKFPVEERFALCDQMRRAASSIPSNIAECAGRISKKEKLRFIEYAQGSLSETMCQLELSFDVGYINKAELDSMDEKAIVIQKLLSGLYNSYNDYHK